MDVYQRFSSPDRMILLAPGEGRPRTAFRHVCESRWLHNQLQSEMQRLRGSIYLQDGAIGASDLASDGRHILPYDNRSWHLLSIDAEGRVVGCTRYLLHSKGSNFNDLRVRNSALARSETWGTVFRAAVEKELAAAWRSNFSYVEVGGWAMAPEVRGTAECLRSVLATYAWSRLIGGALGISTATERNGSASILGRLGGRSLDWDGTTIPSYFDPQYGCHMHMLRFDSRHPNPRYEQVIRQLQHALVDIPVICADPPMWNAVTDGFRPLTAPSIMHPAAMAAAAI